MPSHVFRTFGWCCNKIVAMAMLLPAPLGVPTRTNATACVAHHSPPGTPEFTRGGTWSSSHLLCLPTSSSSSRSGRCRAQLGGQPGGRNAGRVVVTREHGKNGKLMKALVSVPWLFHHPRGSSGFTCGSSANFTRWIDSLVEFKFGLSVWILEGPFWAAGSIWCSGFGLGICFVLCCVDSGSCCFNCPPQKLSLLHNVNWNHNTHWQLTWTNATILDNTSIFRGKFK